MEAPNSGRVMQRSNAVSAPPSDSTARQVADSAAQKSQGRLRRDYGTATQLAQPAEADVILEGSTPTELSSSMHVAVSLQRLQVFPMYHCVVQHAQ